MLSPTATDFFLELISAFSVHALYLFSKNFSRVTLVSAAANADSFVGLQNKIDFAARRHRRLMQVPVLSARRIEIGSEACVIVYHNS